MMKTPSVIKSALMVALSVITIFGIASCGGTGGGDSGGGGESGRTIAVTGSFIGGAHATNTWLKRAFAWMVPTAKAMDPNLVSRVIALYGDGGYESAPVTDGAFSIHVKTGNNVGLIFVGATNNFLGYLTLGSGIDVLPLMDVPDGITTINLETLSSNGAIITASHDPLSAELQLTAEELDVIGLTDDFFASVIKDPDSDGDGVVDFLDGKSYRLQILYFVTGGSFGLNLTPATVANPPSINGYSLAFDATCANRPTTVSFTGPAGSGLTNSLSDQSNVYHDRTTYFSPYIAAPTIPPAGVYTVTINSTVLSFTLPDQSSAPTSIILPVPTVILNGNGTIHQVNWSYVFNGAPMADTLAVMERVMVQIEGTGTPCSNYVQGPSRLYNADNLSPSTTQHVLTLSLIHI